MIQAAPKRAKMKVEIKEESDLDETTGVADCGWCEDVNENVYLTEDAGDTTAHNPSLGVTPTSAGKGYGLIQKGGGGVGTSADYGGKAKGADYGGTNATYYGEFADYDGYGGYGKAKSADYGGKGGKGGKSYAEQGRAQAAGSARSTKRRGGAGEKLKRAQIAGSDECIAAMASLFRKGWTTWGENEVLLRAYGSTALAGFVEAARAQIGGASASSASSSSGKRNWS